METLSRKGAIWTEEELAILARDRRNKVPAKLTAAHLDRPLHSVRAIGRLKTGIVVQPHKPADPEEDARIAEMVHAGATDPQIAEATGRSVGSVRHRIEALQLAHIRKKPVARAEPKTRAARTAKPKPALRPRFSKDDIAHLRDRAGKDSAADIAAALGRSEGSIFSKASALKISLDLPRERKVDLDEFKAAFASDPDSAALAKRFGVHKATINRLARELDLVLPRTRRRFDEAARRAIIEAAASQTVTQVAKATGWDIRTVKRVAEEEGLVFLAASRPSPKPKAPKLSAPKPARQLRRKATKPARVVLPAQVRPPEREAVTILSVARPQARKVPEMPVKPTSSSPSGKLASKPGVARNLAEELMRRDSKPVPRPAEKPRGGNTRTLSMIAQIAQRMKKDGRLPRH
jgi:hypothetical protein